MLLRRLEIALGIAAAVVWGWRAQRLATIPIYCFTSSTGAQSCAGLFDPRSSYVLALVILASLGFLVGVAGALIHGLTGRRAWRRALWVAALLLLDFSLLGILTLGWETLPGAALLLLSALCSLGARPQPAHRPA